jgi:hypothetical protein
MSLLELKKYFTKNTSMNFLNEFTLQDVEDAKRMIYMKHHKTQGESYKSFLDKAAERLAKDRFYAGIKEEQGLAVKNTVRDVLNANYKNTITRLILVDSQFRPQLNEGESNFLYHLNEKVVNAISIEMIHIQIPYTFYNIEARQGNDRFFLIEGAKEYLVILPSGYYPTVESIRLGLNTAIAATFSQQTPPVPVPNLSFEFSQITQKIALVNRESTPYTIRFLVNESHCKINHCIGWHMGFRQFQGSNIANQTITLDYEIPSQVSLTPGRIEASAVAIVPHTKYFVVVVDDFNNNQTADTMVQSNITPENSKRSSYFTQDPYLNELTPYNLSSYLANVPNRTLTKNQLFTISQQNLEKINLGVQNTRVEVHAPNQVLAVVPFETSRVNWGDMYFADKNKYVREYHSPTSIDRLHVKIYDDKGYLLDFNGNNWFMTLITNNLYKY